VSSRDSRRDRNGAVLWWQCEISTDVANTLSLDGMGGVLGARRIGSGFGNYCCKRGAGRIRSLMRQPKCSDLHGLKFTILRRSAERLVTGLRATYYAYRQIRNE